MKRQNDLRKLRTKTRCIIANNQIEKQYGREMIVGSDECGVGSLVGPVISAAVKYDERLNSLPLYDSKKFSKRERERLYGLMMDMEIEYAIGCASIEEVNMHNVLNAAEYAESGQFYKKH